MPRLAIIIPAVRSIESLEETLLSVLENRPEHCEILVVLNQSYGDPYDLEGEVRFIAAGPGDDWVNCANLGVHESRSEVVHLLASGCTVSPGWVDAPLAKFADSQIAAVAPLVLDIANQSRVASAGLRWGVGGTRRLPRGNAKKLSTRAAVPTFGACSWAAFYRKAALDAVGGLPADVGDELADVDLAWSLHHAGYSSVLAPASHVHVPAELRAEPRGFQHGLHRERMFWRHAPAVGWLASLVCHPWAIAAETVLGFPRPAMVTQLLGRAWGAIQVGRHRRHWAWLETLQHNPVLLPVSGSTMQTRVDKSHAKSQGATKKTEQKRLRA